MLQRLISSTKSGRLLGLKIYVVLNSQTLISRKRMADVNFCGGVVNGRIVHFCIRLLREETETVSAGHDCCHFAQRWPLHTHVNVRITNTDESYASSGARNPKVPVLLIPTSAS
jgi:hypothetical protein